MIQISSKIQKSTKNPKHKHHLPILFLMKTTGIGIFFLTFEENLPSCWQKWLCQKTNLSMLYKWTEKKQMIPNKVVEWFN